MKELPGVPDDTSPEAREKYLELIRSLSAEQRLERTFALSTFVKNMMLENIRSEYPDAGDKEVKEMLARRMYGAEVCREFIRLRDM